MQHCSITELLTLRLKIYYSGLQYVKEDSSGGSDFSAAYILPPNSESQLLNKLKNCLHIVIALNRIRGEFYG